ncbi:hypothetical protein FRC17_010075 [Serendipita sp. 399]|nr:hypothetical protein FRC17_010075 [Serendipita sp. 399]
MTKRPRVEDEPSPVDGSKPISLQRRRVWRGNAFWFHVLLCVLAQPALQLVKNAAARRPVCSQCNATGTRCVWTQTKDRAALSRHYVQELEARLLYMEQLFKQHIPDVEVFPKEGSGIPLQMAKNIPALNPFPSAAQPQDDTLVKEDDLDVLSHVKREEESTLTDHFGQMALDAEGHLRWIGGSSTMTLIETFRNETADQEEEGLTPSSDQSEEPNVLYFPTGLGFGKLRALPSAEEVEYPERDLADKLVEAYFERFHFLLPVLDKPSFLLRYTRLMDNDGKGELPGFVAVVFAVFTCAARFMDDPRIKSGHYKEPRGTAMIFYERRVYSAMMLYIIDHTSTQLAHVQCFALLSAFLASLNRLPQAWLLVGQAVRTAQDLGLHRSPKPLKLSQVDKETRRKVWWCVYGLDRCLALQLGRPLGVDDSDVDVDLPIPYDDVDLPDYYAGKLPEPKEPSLMEGFVALTALYKIAGKVLRHVYATDKLKGNVQGEKVAELLKVVDKLDDQLTLWVDNLHPTLRQSPTTPQMTSMSAVLCSSYYAVLITLHRNFLPTRRNIMHTVGSSSVPRAVSASRSCIYLATSMKPAIPPSHHLAVFVQSLFSSAIIILLVVMHATDKAAASIAMSEVDNCVNSLEASESLWPGASKCKEVLKELAQVTSANLAKVDKSKAPRHSSNRSVQLSSPAASTRSDSQGASPLAQSPQPGANGARVPVSSLVLGGSPPAGSTPSPSLSYLAPAKEEKVTGKPLTIRDPMVAHSSTKEGPRSPSKQEFGVKTQDYQFRPVLPQAAMLPGSAQRLPSPPVATYLSEPRIYGPHSNVALSYGTGELINSGLSAEGFYGVQPTGPSTWVTAGAHDMIYEPSDLQTLSGMDFMHNLVSFGPMQVDDLWQNIPGVFSAEPRMFGINDESQDGL